MATYQERPPTFQNLRNLKHILPEDTDMYARDDQDQIWQRVVRFQPDGQLLAVEWIPFEGGGFCQAPADNYSQLLEEEFYGDPRSAASSLRSHYGGNPEERSSGLVR